MTTTEAGRRLGVSGTRIWQYIKEGRLPSERAGRIHLVTEQDLEALKRTLTEESPRRTGPKPRFMKAKTAEV